MKQIKKGAANTVSIPQGNRAVKKAMVQLLGAFSLKGGDLSVKDVEGMTIEDIVASFQVLIGTGKYVNVSTKFRIGDIYNLLGEKHRTVRRQAMKIIADRFSENDRQTLRCCGWVASKWPKEERDDKYGWTFYLRNVPGEPAYKRPVKLPIYEAIESEDRGNTFLIECVGKAGKHFMVSVNKSLVDPVEEGRTHEEAQGQVPASA